MKLSSVKVTDFWSVRDSNTFDIGGITCLVGKNESGKTALLQALYRLNPIISEYGHFDVTDDFPRADVEDYQQAVESGERDRAIIINATFTLDEADLKGLEDDFGPNILDKPKLSLSKGYANTTFVTLDVNEKEAIKSFLDWAKLPIDLSQELSKSANFKELLAFIDEKKNDENEEHIERLNAALADAKKAGTLADFLYQTYLKARLPKFLYFDEYYLMRGHENIQALRARMQKNNLKRSDRPLLGLVELARLDLEDLIDPERTEWLVNKLEGAGNHLTKKILKYWSQNRHLQMRFEVSPARPGDPEGMTSGTNIWVRVYDSKHLVTTLVGSRSRGFVWFFSFLAWFDQEQKKKGPIILLLDEPGLLLHGKAQGDLLDYIENELRGQHQVIYTTHSPFMVDPKKFDRVRIVQDRSMDTENDLPPEEQGTKVITDVLEATEDSLFPLQGALGYEIHQSLFVGPNSLIVEGVSDLLYLQTMSGILEGRGREGLSPKWTITPVGGAEKVPTFVALLGSQKGLKIATLIDIQRKDEQTIENLYKRKLLKKKYVLTFRDFCAVKEADIEDMFGAKFYLKLVNAEYKSALTKEISPDDLSSQSPRLLVRLENYFKENPLKDSVIFNHYRPARYFSENIGTTKDALPNEALDRFERAFRELNNLLWEGGGRPKNYKSSRPRR